MFGAPYKMNGDLNGTINASILCINPIKCKNIFPLNEIRDNIEPLLHDSIIKDDNLKIYELKNRYNRNYFDDGVDTNDIDVMKKLMISVLIFL